MFSYQQFRTFLHEPIGKIVVSRWVISALFLPIAVLNRTFNVFPQLTTMGYIVEFLAVVIIFSFLLSCLSYIAVVRQWKSVILIGTIHVFLDVAIITFITYFAGGAESELFTMYIFPILFALILFFDNRAAYFILVCVASYVVMVYLDTAGLIPHQSAMYPRQLMERGNRAVHMKIFFLVQLSLGILFVIWMIRRIMNDREYRITREKQNMQTLVEAIPQGLVMVNEDHRVLMMNDTARRYLSLSKEERGDFLRHTPGGDCEELYAALKEQPIEPQLDREVRLRCGSQDQALIVNTLPIAEGKENPQLWLHILHDVTERRAFAQLKSDFVSIAAHQLRTPLSGLKWFFDQMIEDTTGQLSVEQTGQLHAAQEQNEKIIGMVNDLLHISEIEAKETQMQLKPLSVRDLVGTAVHSVKPRANEAGVTIDVEDFDGEVVGDWRQMHILLSNVIENAIKYSSTGGAVVVTAAEDDSGVHFTIRDSGIGISEEDLKRIFMKFFRSRDAQRMEGSGSGLGLYIVRKIVQAHGGKIAVDSVHGEGTTFTITIPHQ